jgi:hypothetical protein
VFLTISQTRLLLAAIGIVAALVLALDLTRMSRGSHTGNQPSVYVGIPRNTPGSTAHLRAAFRASLLRRAADAAA